MGKRKRDSDHNLIESSSDAMQCSSGMEILSEEKRLLAIDNGELKPCPSVLDVSDSSAKLQNPQQQQQQPSTANHHQSHGRPVFMRRTRQHFGHHYSRRGSPSVASNNPSSSSRGKSAMRDEKLSAKLVAQCTELGRLAELRERAFLQRERIRPSDDAIPTEELAMMVCWICQKKLVQRIYLPDTGQAAILSEVAVIACGHAYHSECLDTKTSFEDKRDPPCPLCTGSLSHVDEERRED